MRKKMTAALLGSLLLSIGINFFLEPFELMDGGIIGISLICYYLWNLKVGVTIICLSVPIFVFTWFYKREYFFNSLLGMLVSSLLIDWLHPLQPYVLQRLHWAPLPSAIMGGAWVGVGIGLMLRRGISTGGTDLAAQLAAIVLPVNTGILIYILDFLVICAGKIVLPSDRFILSLLTITAVGIATTLCVRTVPG